MCCNFWWDPNWTSQFVTSVHSVSQWKSYLCTNDQTGSLRVYCITYIFMEKIQIQWKSYWISTLSKSFPNSSANFVKLRDSFTVKPYQVICAQMIRQGHSGYICTTYILGKNIDIMKMYMVINLILSIAFLNTEFTKVIHNLFRS